MARILAIANIKGGVGKTTTAANLAAALAERGHRVLAIDLDPQASLTLAVGIQPDQLSRTIRDALTSRAVAASSLCISTGEKFDLIPANHDLRTVERELDRGLVRPYALRDAIEPLRGLYDYILLDCPASAGILTGNALAAATGVVVPFPPDFLALEAVDWLMRIIQEIRTKLNPNLRVMGFLLAMYSPRAQHTQDIITKTRTRFGMEIPFFNSSIMLDDHLREAPMLGQSVLHYAPRSAPAASYRRLAQEIEEGIQEPEPADGQSAVRRARVAQTRGDRAAAYQDFCHATELNPDLVEAWAGRAETAQDSSEIIRCWARVLQLNPSSEQARTNLNSHLAARLSRTNTPPDIAELMTLGYYLVSAQQRAQADQVFGHVTQLDSKHVEAWLGRASVAPDGESALEYCRKALELAPQDSHVQAELEESKRRIRSEAIALVDEAHGLDQIGQREQAHQLFVRAAALDPENVRAWMGCARTSDDERDAFHFAERAARADPNNVEAANLYHWLWIPERQSWLAHVPWMTLFSVVLALLVLGGAAFLLLQALGFEFVLPR